MSDIRGIRYEISKPKLNEIDGYYYQRASGLDEKRASCRSPAHEDDLVMDHADTAPCEILPMYALWEDEAG